jgi:hypothetical protein
MAEAQISEAEFDRRLRVVEETIKVMRSSLEIHADAIRSQEAHRIRHDNEIDSIAGRIGKIEKALS